MIRRILHYLTHVPFLHWFVAVSVGLLGFRMLSLSYTKNLYDRSVENQRLLIRADQIQNETNRVMECMADVDRSVKSYILAGSPYNIEDYTHVHDNLDHLTVLLNKNRDASDVKTLRLLVNERLHLARLALTDYVRGKRRDDMSFIRKRVALTNSIMGRIENLCRHINADTHEAVTAFQAVKQRSDVTYNTYKHWINTLYQAGWIALFFGVILHHNRSQKDYNFLVYQSETIQRVGNIGVYSYNYLNPKCFIEDSSKVATNLMGIPERRLGDPRKLVLDFFYRLRPEDQNTLRDAFEACTHNGVPYDIDVCMSAPDNEGGTQRWLNMRGNATYNNHWEFQKVMGTVMDITARKDSEELIAAQVKELQDINAELHVRQIVLEDAHQNALEMMATDALTQLRKQDYFHEALEKEFLRAKEYNGTFCVAILDIDGLRLFNENYGHSAGNDVLCAVSQAIQKSVRSTDTVSRYGGDEFAVLMPVLDRDDALRIMDRTRERVEKIQVFQRSVSISIGVATRDNQTLGSHQLTNEAEAAMMLVKNRGGNGVAHFASVSNSA